MIQKSVDRVAFSWNSKPASSLRFGGSSLLFFDRVFDRIILCQRQIVLISATRIVFPKRLQVVLYKSLIAFEEKNSREFNHLVCLEQCTAKQQVYGNVGSVNMRRWEAKSEAADYLPHRYWDRWLAGVRFDADIELNIASSLFWKLICGARKNWNGC